MELVISVLIAVIIILALKVHSLSKRKKQANLEHRKAIGQLQDKVSTLDRDKAAIAHEKAALQMQLDKRLQEISRLKYTLKETERERDFYKNIDVESGELNVASTAVQVSKELLDSEQSALYDEMENSFENFFITGKAGTGKSFLLNTFRKETQKGTIVLAPTGIAALNVSGATLHSAFGYYNLVNLDIDEISSRTIRLKSEKQLVLKHVSTIIIDEISMVRSDTFDKIDRILKAINHNDKPFGGKQILLFGDLFQLSPIAHPKEREYLYDRYGGMHFFCADAYKQANFLFRELTINHRQKEDAEYFELLNRVRDGSVTSEDIKSLNERIVQDFSVYDRFTTLLPTKAEVERLNQNHIRQLKSDEYTYEAAVTHDKYPDKNRSLESLFPINKTLRLKKGVLVMMVANDPERRWVNGTLGVVRGLSKKCISVSIDTNVYDIHPFEFSEQEVTYEDGKLKYENILTVTQYPIIPAYAITIHKSQGQTYKNVICDIDRCFADGQAYVALSRCANLNGLHLAQQISRASIRVDRNVLDFYHKSISQNI